MAEQEKLLPEEPTEDQIAAASRALMEEILASAMLAVDAVAQPQRARFCEKLRQGLEDANRRLWIQRAELLLTNGHAALPRHALAAVLNEDLVERLWTALTQRMHAEAKYPEQPRSGA